MTSKLYARINENGKWLSTDVSGSCYPTAYTSKALAEKAQKLYGGKIVELVIKPKLERLTAEEASVIELAKQNDYPAERFSDYVGGDADRSEARLIRAYVNGYAVKKEPRWYVMVPHTGRRNGLSLYYFKSPRSVNSPAVSRKWYRAGEFHSPDYQFTQAEIDRYGLQDCEREEITED